eukprot:6639327-Prymnesium_polylepis.1
MWPGTFPPLRLRLWSVPLSRARLSRASASDVPPGLYTTVPYHASATRRVPPLTPSQLGGRANSQKSYRNRIFADFCAAA